MRKLAAMAVGVIAVAATTAMGAAGAQTASGGTVTVLHGIPDLTVDVYVNGDLTLDDFAPGTVTATVKTLAIRVKPNLRAGR